MPTAGCAFITGGAVRLGRAFALHLAGRGFDVALHYGRSAAAAREVAQGIEALGRRVVLLPADLTQEQETSALIAQARTALGPVTLLLNNAAIFEFDTLERADRATWDRHMEINLRAPFLLTQEFARHLPPDQRGLIVNIIDERVWNLTPNYASYTVSKYALWGLTQHAARALAPRIRVNAIGPGPALKPPETAEATWESLCTEQPLQRGTTPDELCHALNFFIDAPAVTGQMIALDGGMHMGWLPPARVERLT